MYSGIKVLYILKDVQSIGINIRDDPVFVVFRGDLHLFMAVALCSLNSS